MNEMTLEVRGLCVDIPVQAGELHAVRGVDLDLRRGETLCIVGESGCGKSMTSLALLGLLPGRAVRSADRIRLLGEDLRQASVSRMRALRGDRIAMVFQDPMTALNPAFTVGNQLVEGIRCHRPEVDKATATARAVQLLETCGIGQARRRMAQYPHQLSGGLRQRVMIAMALMTEPDLLIADEPTTALDATIQAQILDLLADLQRRHALAVILVTHDFDVVRRIGHRVAVMYAGEVVESGSVDEVLARPMHPYTRALLSCIPSEASHRGGRRLGYLPGTVPSLVGNLHGCQFRNRCSLAQSSCAATVPCQRHGPEAFYRCTIPSAAMPRGATPESPPPASDRAAGTAEPRVAVDIQGLHVTYSIGSGLFASRSSLHALRGIDLSLQAGQALGVVGESGSGKSTLARVLLGLEQPSSGQVRLNGRPVGELARRERARVVQPIFQDPYASLNPRRGVAAAIRMPLDVHAVGTPSERRAEVARMMALCGLAPRLAEALPSQLSGGQRQRVAIASALIMRPEILVCDEPTSALDVSVQAQILNLLQDIRQEVTPTSVVISHDLSVIRCLSDRVIVMYLGAVVEDRTVEDLFAAPAHPYTRMLLSAASVGGDAVKVAGEFPNPVNPPSGCAFHPRCTRAQDICRTRSPALAAMQGGRVACFFPLSTEGSGD